MAKILFLAPLTGRLIICGVFTEMNVLWICFLIYIYIVIVIGLVCCSTLRRWRKGQLVENWEAHKSAIQAIIKLPSGELVTGIFFA